MMDMGDSREGARILTRSGSIGKPKRTPPSQYPMPVLMVFSPTSRTQMMAWAWSLPETTCHPGRARRKTSASCAA